MLDNYCNYFRSDEPMKYKGLYRNLVIYKKEKSATAICQINISILLKLLQSSTLLDLPFLWQCVDYPESYFSTFLFERLRTTEISNHPVRILSYFILFYYYAYIFIFL